MATKIMCHVNGIIIDLNAKYGEDWAYIDEAVTS